MGFAVGLNSSLSTGDDRVLWQLLPLYGPISLSQLSWIAPLLWLAELHGFLDFVGEAVEMLVQFVEHLSLDTVCGQVANQRSLSGIPSKLFN